MASKSQNALYYFFVAVYNLTYFLPLTEECDESPKA